MLHEADVEAPPPLRRNRLFDNPLLRRRELPSDLRNPPQARHHPSAVHVNGEDLPVERVHRHALRHLDPDAGQTLQVRLCLLRARSVETLQIYGPFSSTDLGGGLDQGSRFLRRQASAPDRTSERLNVELRKPLPVPHRSGHPLEGLFVEMLPCPRREHDEDEFVNGVVLIPEVSRGIRTVKHRGYLDDVKKVSVLRELQGPSEWRNRRRHRSDTVLTQDPRRSLSTLECDLVYIFTRDIWHTPGIMIVPAAITEDWLDTNEPDHGIPRRYVVTLTRLTDDHREVHEVTAVNIAKAKATAQAQMEMHLSGEPLVAEAVRDDGFGRQSEEERKQEFDRIREHFTDLL